MIIPFTDRVKARPVVIFTTFVFLGQRLENTDMTFSLLTAAFIIISAIAYNAGRGLSHPTGAYVFFNALLTAIVGLTYKIFLGEPGESNLQAPNKTMLAYCVCIATVGIVASLSHHLRPKRPLLPNLDVETMRYAAIGCLFVGAIVQLQTTRYSNEAGTFSSALRQLNYLPRMSLIFAIIYQLAKSDGKSSTNWIVWASGLFMFFYGVIGFSKEGLFMSVVTWALTCILYRYDFKWKQLAICGLFVLVAQFILVPFAQYGRRSRSATTTTEAVSLAAALQYLKDPFGTRNLYLSEMQDVDYTATPHLYDSPQGFMDRMNMLSFDDALVSYTDTTSVFGLYPVIGTYLNVIPHFLWKDKPTYAFGNDYAHEIQVVAEDDDTTGISFGPVGDAYHEAKWFGILVVFPPIIFLYFFITESLTGGVRDTPYALLPIALAAHAAPEGMMTTPIYLETYGALLLIMIAVLAKYVLARFTRVAMGGDKTRVLLTQNVFLAADRPAPPSAPTPQTP